MLRQQWEREGQTTFRSLADYVAPVDSGVADYLGAFAVTAGLGADELVDAVRGRPRRLQRDHDQGPGRPAGRGVRRDAARAGPPRLGLRPDENLSNDDLIDEKYRGIRPAAGYPSCPDHTEKGTLWDLLDAEGGDRHPADGELRDVPGRLGQRLYFAPSRGAVLRGRHDHARPGRGLRRAQGDADRARSSAGWRRTWRTMPDPRRASRFRAGCLCRPATRPVPRGRRSIDGPMGTRGHVTRPARPSRPAEPRVTFGVPGQGATHVDSASSPRSTQWPARRARVRRCRGFSRSRTTQSCETSPGRFPDPQRRRPRPQP